MLDVVNAQLFAQSDDDEPHEALTPLWDADDGSMVDIPLEFPSAPLDPNDLDALVWLALLNDRLGARQQASVIKGVMPSFDAAVAEWQSAAVAAMLVGADWEAARAALQAISAQPPSRLMVALWHAICAAHAGNRAALSMLVNLDDRAARFWDPMLLGLAKTAQIDEADRIIAEVGPRHTSESWMLERLRADTRLDAADDAPVREAATRLEALASHADIPLIHRAEIFHNLGVAKDRLGERQAALSSFQQAQTLNPYLDAAQQEIKSLTARMRDPRR